MANKRNDRKDQRRKEAIVRQEVYSAMSPIQILSLLDRNGLVAKKERYKLAKRIQ
jgi:hypothetical protein